MSSYSYDEWSKSYNEWKKALLESGMLPSTPSDQSGLICISHEPETYVGFTDTFVFCRACDAKQKDGIWQK